MTHVHTMIKDPSIVRKEILSSTLESVEFLKSLQNLDSIRQRKTIYLSKVMNSLRNLKIIQGKIAQSLPILPKEYDPALAKKQKEDSKSIVPKEKKEVKPHAAFSERQRLDSEIRELHRRISNLQI